MNILLTSWKDRALAKHEKRDPADRGVEITVEFVAQVDARPAKDSDPWEVNGTLQWVAAETPDIPLSQKTEWIVQLLRGMQTQPKASSQTT